MKNKNFPRNKAHYRNKAKNIYNKLEIPFRDFDKKRSTNFNNRNVSFRIQFNAKCQSLVST